MKRFNVCCLISGCIDVIIDAETEEEAIEKAMEEAYGKNWNEMYFPEIEAGDIYEEVSK